MGICEDGWRLDVRPAGNMVCIVVWKRVWLTDWLLGVMLLRKARGVRCWKSRV